MKLTIIGASGHGKVVADIARLNGYDEIEFLDDDPALHECAGYPVVGNSDMASDVDSDVFVAIGNASIRRRVMEGLDEKSFPTLVHPSASIAGSATLGAGTVVMAGAVVNPDATVGRGCIVNTCASVDHDCVVGDYVHVAVGAHLCGTVSVGDGTWVGAGATVSNNLSVCAGVTIGAGATVVSDVGEPGTYVGCPAKPMRDQRPVRSDKRVLILANFAQGIYSFRREVVQALVERYEVWFCVPEAGDDEHVQALCALGARHVQARHLSRRGTNPLEDEQLLIFYNKLLREVAPSVVLTYTIKPNVYGGIACQMQHIPYIANVTGLGTSIQNGGALQRLTLGLYRRGLRGACKVFFQNSANRDFMVGRGVVSGPHDVLPGSGVNTEWFGLQDYPSEDEPLSFLTVGRIMRDKGTAELIEAARIVRRQHPEVKFQLLGSFDEDWEQAVANAVAEGVIEHIPQQEDVRPFYAGCAALVHPSYHEGMSNVCLEAASAGRPVIASAIPGCRETFDEGVTGLGFEPKSAESLAEALERFIAVPWEERRAMGFAGREKVIREFDRQIVVDKYLAEIEKIAKE